MPSTFDQSYRLQTAFPKVLRAIPQKYPNEHAAHVVSVDTIDVSFDEEGRLRLERLIGVEQSAPAIILKVRWSHRPLAELRATAHRQRAADLCTGNELLSAFATATAAPDLGQSLDVHDSALPRIDRLQARSRSAVHIDTLPATRNHLSAGQAGGWTDVGSHRPQSRARQRRSVRFQRRGGAGRHGERAVGFVLMIASVHHAAKPRFQLQNGTCRDDVSSFAPAGSTTSTIAASIGAPCSSTGATVSTS